LKAWQPLEFIEKPHTSREITVLAPFDSTLRRSWSSARTKAGRSAWPSTDHRSSPISRSGRRPRQRLAITQATDSALSGGAGTGGLGRLPMMYSLPVNRAVRMSGASPLLDTTTALRQTVLSREAVRH
jgi:hypothetical protein